MLSYFADQAGPKERWEKLSSRFLHCRGEELEVWNTAYTVKTGWYTSYLNEFFPLSFHLFCYKVWLIEQVRRKEYKTESKSKTKDINKIN